MIQCQIQRKIQRRWIAILGLAAILYLLSLDSAVARPLPQEGAPVYGLLGTFRPSRDERFTTEFVTAFETFPVVGANPEIDRQIQEISRINPPVQVKVWGRAIELFDESSQRQILVQEILRLDELTATATPPPASRPPYAVVTEPGTTIRSEPSAAGAVIAQVRQGREFDIIGRDSSLQWWQICCINEQTGWIFRFMVSPQGDLERVPIVSATPPTPTPVPVVPTPVSTALPAVDWVVSYFANPNLQGAPLFVTRANTINFDWGNGSPVPGLLPVDQFSARFEQTLSLPGGIYRFSVQADDGVRVWIGGELVIDEWHLAAPPVYQVDRQISGPTSIRIEYFEAGGQAKIRFSYQLLSAFPDWQVSYFDNVNLSGEPARIVAEPRTNPSLSRDWGLGSPFPGLLPADSFSARWVGTYFFDGGDYLFWARADDGVRLWIDDILVLDAWSVNPGYVEQTFSRIGRGNHVIRIEYFERGGLARISADWYRMSPLR